ncbi:MAG: DNA mismatch repair endonuclease MutL [Pseudomonadota bacterium]
MSKIRILPENLANQIAAGEVVERPASVVKEFVENSIDAGAGRIILEVEGGGSRLIRVIDDGMGMDQDDMLLSLERHATSKLHTIEELGAINTLGFRGEAIPSIASVSRLTITSRLADAPLGNRVEVRFGQLHKVHEMGCSPGTIMEVRDLFGNVPARRKFLKTTRTELSHIDEIVVNTVLAHANLGFTYHVDGREALSFAAGSESLEWRVREIMGGHLQKNLIPVDWQQEDMTLSGFLLPPDEGASPAARFRVFVNRRPVRDRMIGHAVVEGMHNFLMKGRKPCGVVFLSLDPEMVDVNVHPTKQEIRFRDSRYVHRMVVQAVSRAMESFQTQMKFSLFGQPVNQYSPAESERPGMTASVSSLPASPRNEHGKSPVVPPTKLFSDRMRPHSTDKTNGVLTVAEPSPQAISTAFSVQEEKNEVAQVLQVVTEKPELPGLRYVGQFLKSYLLCETNDGIGVIDQHAAHERLIFERLRKQYHDMQLPGQSLLFPEIIECTPAQAEILTHHDEEIRRLGVSIQEFGGMSYVIKAIPAILGHLGPLEIINGIFDHFLNREGKEKSAPRRIDDVLALMACKAAIKANDALLTQEGEELVRKMEEADIFSHCPHGRPVVKFFSESDIKKWFFR